MKDPYESYMCGGADPFDYGEHDEEIKEKAVSFFEDVRRQWEGGKNKNNIFGQKNDLITLSVLNCMLDHFTHINTKL